MYSCKWKKKIIWLIHWLYAKGVDSQYIILIDFETSAFSILEWKELV